MDSLQYQEGICRHPQCGRSLFYRLWKPPAFHKLLVVVHGFGEHSGRYQSIASDLAERGMAVACPDLWGHGRSGGARGDIERFGYYVDDLEVVIGQVLGGLGGRTPDFAVFGHSFGGLLAVHWALRHPTGLHSLILQSPLLGIGFPVPQWKQHGARLFAKICGELALSTGLDPAALSHDATVVRLYRDDPLVHDRISLRGYISLQEAIREAHKESGRLTTSTLVLYGNNDRIISIKACRDFFERLNCPKRIIEFPGCFHELHHESVKHSVIEEITKWVQRHGSTTR